ncbi:nucleotide exchange factor GrpE [Schlesneria paludicola]|uniref:nucleotide exchange factor GrpE n=1 Tax=Schlesneria paludicola TaxID=360056 RepID=UPI000299F95B|nr:nucleotide exchange factor GrpE [Schlesneria paludicola]
MTEPKDETTPADASAPATLKEQLQAANEERDQFKDKWARAMADLENFRKRVYREMDDERKYQAAPILKSLLPVFDGLDRAIFAASQAKNFDDLLNGVQLTLKQWESILAGHGAKPITAVGQPFDPNLHEAISQVPSADHPPMTVLNDVERGYTLHDRVIRPSKVVVSAAPPTE